MTTQEDNQDVSNRQGMPDYIILNAELNFYDKDRKVQYSKDREAVRDYFINEVNPNTVYFHTLEEKLGYLKEEGYYETEFLDKYTPEFIKDLYKTVYEAKFRFASFVSAFKFYGGGYALKMRGKQRYLERFEDRIAAVALYLGQGNEKYATELAQEMISGRFQPATPTFLNAGKKARGELVSCFLLNVEDDLNSIMRSVNSAAQLSKRGGGVALNLSNIRASEDPIKGIPGAASGVVPVMKILEDTFSYANQLGARQGAGAVYLNAHHLDIMEFLDTKRENADEKVRIKTLSLGVVIPDITFQLARDKEDMYLFSPHDMQREYGKEFAWLNISEIYREAVDNPNIRKKKINPRDFLNTLAEIQMESGYPYVMFEDAVNRANQVGGKITMSNLCSEILQPQRPSVVKDDQSYETLGTDISCNLGSLNVRKALESPDFGKTIETSLRSLMIVSELSSIDAVPTVKNGNDLSHSVGLGAMNLHGTFAHHKMVYGDEESLDLTNMYFYLVTYHAVRTNMLVAKEKGQSFAGFKESNYASGEFFEKFIDKKNAKHYRPHTPKVKKIFKDFFVPTAEDWEALAKQVKEHGMFSAHMQAVPPTGSISYINNSTSSIHPVDVPGGLVMARAEGKMGTLYYPTPEAEGNEEFYSENMFSIDSKKVIDVYSIAQHYVDQGLSLTLGYRSSSTTRNIVQNTMYAYGKGKKLGTPLNQTQIEEQVQVQAEAKGWNSEQVSQEIEKVTRTEMLKKYPQGEIKTMYYVRIMNDNLEATQNNECVSCAL